MKISRQIFLTFLLVAASFASFAQLPELIKTPEFRPVAKAAVDSIYNFNFEGAEETLAPWKQKYPEHPLWTLFDGMQLWWKVLSDLEDKSRDKEFYHVMKKADYEAGKLLHKAPSHADGLLIRAISNGYLARQHANRGDWITSLNYGRKAMNVHSYLRDRQPNLKDLKLAEGLKLYYAAHLPEAYPIVKTVTWIFPDGNKQKGLELIKEASQEAVFARAEATYFLGNINYNYEKDYAKAVQNFERLLKQYPHNNYYVRILAKSYYKQHLFDKALSYIDTTTREWQQHQLPYKNVVLEELLTWKGRILERRGRKQQALECYKEAFDRAQELPNTENRSFYVISGYLAGRILYEGENYEEAKSYLAQVKKANAEDAYRRRAGTLLTKLVHR